MSKTRENLKEALQGEAKASIAYQAFAKKADEEGFSGIALLFRAVAAAETVHAGSHQCVLREEEEIINTLQSPEKTRGAVTRLESDGKVKSTTENLKSAIEGETYEFTKMYPSMIKEAVAEIQVDARHSFEYAMTV